MWNWRDELQLSWFTILAQITGYSYFYYKAKGLNKLKIHILTERAKMTRKLWLKIMWRDQWRCQIGLQGCTIGAQEVDHKLALFRYGYTVESNLQAACHNCNQRKGTRIL